MSDGINFNMNPVDPLGSLARGLSFGDQLLQRKLAGQQAAQQAAQDEKIQALYTKIQSGEASHQDYRNLSMMLPEEQSKQVREGLASLTEDQQKSALNQSGQIFAALRSGQTDIAVDLMRRQSEAFKNSGNDKDAKVFSDMASLAELGEKGANSAESFFGLTISHLPGGEAVIDSANSLSKDRREGQIQEGEMLKIADSLQLTGEDRQNALRVASDNNQQTAKLILEYAGGKQAGSISAKDTFAFERSLSADYQKSIGNFNEIMASNDAVKAVGDLKTGAGDQALIVLFNKMLDPGSVVRESEAAATMRSQGVLDRITAGISRLTTGEKLSPQLRTDLLSATEKLMTAGENIENRARTRLEAPIKNYGLNEDNVFGPSGEIEQPEIPLQQPSQTPANAMSLDAMRNYIITNNPNSSFTPAEIGAMTEEEIKNRFANGYRAFISQGQEVIEEAPF